VVLGDEFYQSCANAQIQVGTLRDNRADQSENSKLGIPDVIENEGRKKKGDYKGNYLSCPIGNGG
jgi:hypothetical protein